MLFTIAVAVLREYVSYHRGDAHKGSTAEASAFELLANGIGGAPRS